MTIRKALAAGAVAIVGALLTIIGPGDGFDTLTTSDYLTVVLAVLGSGGVTWYVANGPGAQYAKAVVGGLAAGITALLAALADNVVTDNEKLLVISAVLAGAGIVGAIPNSEPPPR